MYMKQQTKQNWGDMETLIKIEKCSDGTLAKHVRYPSGLVVIEFVEGK